MMPVILAVDDEPAIVELVRYNLVKAGNRVLTAHSGREALTVMACSPVDLVVLDLMLPDMTGIEVCRRIRAQSKAPILMLTARSEEVTRVRALEAGADDYLTKPFSTRELMARVKAQIRRWDWQGRPGDGDAVTVGPLRLDLPAHRAVFAGQELHLTPMEFNILRVLCGTPGRVFPREQLLTLATGHEAPGDARNVDVHIRSLRLKLEADPANPRFLVTVRGCGYRVATAV